MEPLLERIARSEPYERLLADRARPILRRADAGHDAAIAALATALGGPVLAVAPGPREADELEHGVRAFLGADRVAVLPAWEALPSEGISPTAETVARRGAVAVIPQDIPVDVVCEVVDWVKRRHVVYDTPITLGPTDTVGEAVHLLTKRTHGALVVVDPAGRPLGVVNEVDYTKSTKLMREPAGHSAIYDKLTLV